MKHHHKILGSSLLALSVALAAAPTLASDDCEAPVARWQSREAVRQMAAQKGWEVQRLKIDDGCYEIRGTDAEGRGFKAKIDPETLKVLKMKQDTHRRDRDGARGRGDEGRVDRPPPPERAADPSLSPANGTAPSGQTQ